MSAGEWDHPTMSPQQFGARLMELVEEEQDLPLRWWWLSFADPQLPRGSQFLGVAIVEAQGGITAIVRTNRLGINPGGEVKFNAFPPGKVPPPELRNRLLSTDDLQQANLLRSDDVEGHGR